MLVERGVEISDGEDNDTDGIEEDKDVKVENGDGPVTVTSPNQADHNNDLEVNTDRTLNDSLIESRQRSLYIRSCS